MANSNSNSSKSILCNFLTSKHNFFNSILQFLILKHQLIQLYLGQVCYSCRAFFRRTVSRMKKKGVKTCRTSEGKCDTSQLFKSCMNCRYRKCLRIGMRPELIGGNGEGWISETERQRDIAPPPQPRSRTEETPRGGREGEPEILSYTDQLLQSTFYNSLGQHRPRGELTQQQVGHFNISFSLPSQPFRWTESFLRL